MAAQPPTMPAAMVPPKPIFEGDSEALQISVQVDVAGVIFKHLGIPLDPHGPIVRDFTNSLLQTIHHYACVTQGQYPAVTADPRTARAHVYNTSATPFEPSSSRALVVRNPAGPLVRTQRPGSVVQPSRWQSTPHGGGAVVRSH